MRLVLIGLGGGEALRTEDFSETEISDGAVIEVNKRRWKLIRPHTVLLNRKRVTLAWVERVR